MPFYLAGCVLTNSQLSSSLGFSLLSVPLSLPSLCILWEAVVWSTFNGFVRDILDFSRRSDTLCVCVCVPTSVCAFLDCRVGSHITALFHLCYCVHSHSKAIRFYTKSWSWELWSWERRNWQAAILQSTSLCSWSLVQYRSPLQLQLHFHINILTLLLYLFSAAHTRVPLSLYPCVAPQKISELPQTSATSLLGSTLFVPALLWTLLLPSTHRLGVAFVPSGANRRLLRPLPRQWHSWLVPFSMLDLASLARMWLERHTEDMKWGVRGGDRRTTARLS